MNFYQTVIKYECFTALRWVLCWKLHFLAYSLIHQDSFFIQRRCNWRRSWAVDQELMVHRFRPTHTEVRYRWVVAKLKWESAINHPSARVGEWVSGWPPWPWSGFYVPFLMVEKDKQILHSTDPKTNQGDTIWSNLTLLDTSPKGHGSRSGDTWRAASVPQLVPTVHVVIWSNKETVF